MFKNNVLNEVWNFEQNWLNNNFTEIRLKPIGFKELLDLIKWAKQF